MADRSSTCLGTKQNHSGEKVNVASESGRGYKSWNQLDGQPGGTGVGRANANQPMGSEVAVEARCDGRELLVRLGSRPPHDQVADDIARLPLLPWPILLHVTRPAK